MWRDVKASMSPSFSCFLSLTLPAPLPSTSDSLSVVCGFGISYSSFFRGSILYVPVSQISKDPFFMEADSIRLFQRLCTRISITILPSCLELALTGRPFGRAQETELVVEN
jgi:hypothetical protein